MKPTFSLKIAPPSLLVSRDVRLPLFLIHSDGEFSGTSNRAWLDRSGELGQSLAIQSPVWPVVIVTVTPCFDPLPGIFKE